ncbi:UDP-N-acetylglucosamine 2-epimerase [Sinobacterium norvegicum]|uniref:UDP-N-acetylglucosamine 2-epimerase (non-hydrolyzing) n=1 Tax=Sinobacterium norvegicum TaxID=1641715 RepID=A0ABM9AJ95_9GAMM|nr:UDP-N-acetylglucosamine 2-epimerase (non-hydrolyzing) [Sinobacterium norvegicum]CAH0993306.1 UDP-N-acetylglucosamine 2-epimerase [Sinobacterium norvegicum]
MKNKYKKILVIFGTRPEAIKMAPLVLALQENSAFECQVCVTGQHREMLDQVTTLFEIKADYDLNIMKPGQDLFSVTADVIAGLKPVFEQSKPDLVMVHGDTTTCMAASISAFYAGIKVAHVEAGLRTGDLTAPFPEEANRKLVANITDFHFSPTLSSRSNLLSEGYSSKAIHVTGNTVIDSLFWVRNKVNNYDEDYWCKYFEKDVLSRIIGDSRKVLITGHRRENFGDGFINICEAIKSLSIKFPDVDFIYPVHLNPNVQSPVNELLSERENVHLVSPLSYPCFVWLMDRSSIVLTDSGGIQEEAPSLGKPVLVMRDVTERPEAVEQGTVKLVGTNKYKIISEISTLLTDADYYKKMSEASNPYGDGKACKRILEILQNELVDDYQSADEEMVV